MENENKKEESDAIDLVDGILAKSESQKDRESLDTTRDFNLVTLLNNQLERAKTKNDLKTEVINRITTRIQDEGDGVPTSALIRLLEILDKGDTDLTLAVINAGKDMSFIKTLSQNKDNEKGLNLTLEDISLIKKLIQSIGFLETLQKTEGE